MKKQVSVALRCTFIWRCVGMWTDWTLNAEQATLASIQWTKLQSTENKSSLQVTCSHLQSQSRSANACYLKYFVCKSVNQSFYSYNLESSWQKFSDIILIKKSSSGAKNPRKKVKPEKKVWHKLCQAGTLLRLFSLREREREREREWEWESEIEVVYP